MKRITSISIVFILSLIIGVTVKAQEGVVPYSVEASLPENQVNNDVTYFDIEMGTGESQGLEVTIFNSSDEAIKVDVSNNSAATNSNGIIIYDGSIEEPHESMDYPFAEISSLEESEVEIDPLGQETVTLNVTAPEESFDGVVLGGLHFTMEPESSEEESELSIQNQYSYVIGVQIREKGNVTAVTPEIEMIGTMPGIVNYRTGLQTEFVNLTPVIIGELKFVGEVYEADSDEPLYTRRDENFTIAPNSRFNFPLMFENQRMEPGTYTFRAQISNEIHEWEFEEEFKITDETAEEANEEAVEIEEDYSWLVNVVISLAVVIIILSGIVIYLLVKRKK